MSRIRNRVASLLAGALALATLPALAAPSRFNPAVPAPFERIDLRLTVDSCSFDPDSVRVEQKGGTLHVLQQPRQCLLPGTPTVVDIQLGAFAPGSYPVELHASLDTASAPLERLTLDVTPFVEAAVYPRPPRPLTNYSGWWWMPSEPGWGLTLMQATGATHGLFGAWHVYDASGAPLWYTLQAGSWTSSTRWSGKIVASTGSWLELPNYDPAAFHFDLVGEVAIEFGQAPGQEGKATLQYTLNGKSGSKVIQRVRF